MRAPAAHNAKTQPIIATPEGPVPVHVDEAPLVLALPPSTASSSDTGAAVAIMERVGLAEGDEVAARSPQMKAWAEASGAEATERSAELFIPGTTSSKLYEYRVPFRSGD